MASLAGRLLLLCASLLLRLDVCMERDRLVLRQNDHNVHESLASIAMALQSDPTFVAIFNNANRNMQTAVLFWDDVFMDDADTADAGRGRPMRAVALDVRRLCNDGIPLPACDHGGVVTQLTTTFHGTQSLEHLLTILWGHGIMAPTVRPAGDSIACRTGWWHSTHFGSAITYGRPFQLGGVRVRCVLQFQTLCANRCRLRSLATHPECLRYHLRYVVFVPCSELPPHVAIF